MTDHETICAQSRAVLMQHKAVPMVYASPNGVKTACRGILSPADAARVPAGQATPAAHQERRTLEVPRDVDENGLARVELAGRFEIDGVTWAIESLPAGAPGTHRVELVRAGMTTHAGRHR